MADVGKVAKVGGVGALVLVAGLGLWARFGGVAEERFCTLGLAFVVIDDREVLLQDGGAPGRDGCDGSETMESGPVLGLDCLIREPDGVESAELTPNRTDGSCGLPDPGDGYPPSWSTG